MVVKERILYLAKYISFKQNILFLSVTNHKNSSRMLSVEGANMGLWISPTGVSLDRHSISRLNVFLMKIM